MFELRKARTAKGMSQKELAEVVGLAPSTIDGFLPVFDRNDDKQLLFSLIVKMGI